MGQNDSSISRRKFLKLTATAFAAGPILLAGGESVPAADTTGTRDKKTQTGALAANAPLRIISVPTAIDGGLLPLLIESFRAETGLSVLLTSSDDPYTPARMGKYDLVISHFGHRDLEKFIMKGFGRWPRTVFSNQLALFGPPSDPAKIRGQPDLLQAFKQIAKARAPYVINNTHGIRYLSEILWRAAGRPAKGTWYIEKDVSKGDALAFAAERGGYVIWGLTPFLAGTKNRTAINGTASNRGCSAAENHGCGRCQSGTSIRRECRRGGEIPGIPADSAHPGKDSGNPLSRCQAGGMVTWRP